MRGGRSGGVSATPPRSGAAASAAAPPFWAGRSEDARKAPPPHCFRRAAKGTRRRATAAGGGGGRALAAGPAQGLGGGHGSDELDSLRIVSWPGRITTPRSPSGVPFAARLDRSPPPPRLSRSGCPWCLSSAGLASQVLPLEVAGRKAEARRGGAWKPGLGGRPPTQQWRLLSPAGLAACFASPAWPGLPRLRFCPPGDNWPCVPHRGRPRKAPLQGRPLRCA